MTGTILALTAAVAFALTNAAASLAFQGGSNPITLAAVRFVLPALVLMVWLAVQGRPVRLPWRDGSTAVALGALTAGYSWALLSAIGAIPLALAILIFYLFPLVATVILGLFGWERLGWKTIVAIVVAFIGLVLALDPRVGPISIEGVLFGFAAALGLGIVVAVSSRVFRAGDARPATLYMATVSAIVLIAFCAQHGDVALPDTTRGWIGFVAAMLFYAFAMIAFFIAVSMIGPARTSLLSYAEPIVSAGLGVAVLGEALTLMQIGGIILMVGALAAATLLKQPAAAPDAA
ncbi:MAG: DMT family transporter [Xanthobacteraceae bacterium]|nr:DMT family transporter [Xanthobacteraceae bacterium]